MKQYRRVIWSLAYIIVSALHVHLSPIRRKWILHIPPCKHTHTHNQNVFAFNAFDFHTLHIFAVYLIISPTINARSSYIMQFSRSKSQIVLILTVEYIRFEGRFIFYTIYYAHIDAFWKYIRLNTILRAFWMILFIYGNVPTSPHTHMHISDSWIDWSFSFSALCFPLNFGRQWISLRRIFDWILHIWLAVWFNILVKIQII